MERYVPVRVSLMLFDSACSKKALLTDMIICDPRATSAVVVGFGFTFGPFRDVEKPKVAGFVPLTETQSKPAKNSVVKSW